MHTENPEQTFKELSRITNPKLGQIACYWYAKKALPRELIDDHFRLASQQLNHDELLALSEQLTELGRRLTDLNVRFDCPEIPALNIKGGEIDIQRFIYWNFLKCFWNESLGRDISNFTNFDWYSPSNAKRFNKVEISNLLDAIGLKEVFFHSEEACFSGRFEFEEE